MGSKATGGISILSILFWIFLAYTWFFDSDDDVKEVESKPSISIEEKLKPELEEFKKSFKEIAPEIKNVVSKLKEIVDRNEEVEIVEDDSPNSPILEEKKADNEKVDDQFSQDDDIYGSSENRY